MGSHEQNQKLPVCVLVTQQEGLGATILFLEWFHQCFIPGVKKYLEKKGLQLKALS